jgi:hypothetical protein
MTNMPLEEIIWRVDRLVSSVEADDSLRGILPQVQHKARTAKSTGRAYVAMEYLKEMVGMVDAAKKAIDKATANIAATKQENLVSVSFQELGETLASLEYPKQAQSAFDLATNPPIARKHDERNLLGMLVYQQAAIIALQKQLIQLQSSINDTTTEVVKELAGLRRDVKSEKTRVESAREKAAKAEEKAASAREKAALAEASVVQPPINIVQAGSSLRRFENRIK